MLVRLRKMKYNLSYTRTVKTAVSVPDPLFRRAEAEARRMRVSRSQLYATALAEFLEKRDDDAITEQLNKVYSRLDATVDPVLERMQFASLPKDNW